MTVDVGHAPKLSVTNAAEFRTQLSRNPGFQYARYQIDDVIARS